MEAPETKGRTPSKDLKSLKPPMKIHRKLDKESWVKKSSLETGLYFPSLSLSAPHPDSRREGEPLPYLSHLRGASWKSSRECSLCAWTCSEYRLVRAWRLRRSIG